MQILEEKRRDTRFSRENNKNTADQEAQRVSRARQPEAAEGLVHSSLLHRELSGRKGKNIRQEWDIRRNLIGSGVCPGHQPVSS